MVCENGYQDKTSEEIQDMFTGHTGAKNYQDWMSAFCTRKYESDFSREMNRSAKIYLKDFMDQSLKESN